MEDTVNRKRKKLLAPLYVIREEKLYYIWIAFVVFFGLINIWAGMFLMKIDSVKAALQEGIVYTYSISICAPFLAEEFVKQIVYKRTERKQAFVFYQIVSSAINVIWILILTFLWLGGLKGAVWMQVICGLFSSFFAFYMYCVGQMEQHKGALGNFDDSKYEYLEAERRRMDTMEKNAKNVKRIENEDGGIEL